MDKSPGPEGRAKGQRDTDAANSAKPGVRRSVYFRYNANQVYKTMFDYYSKKAANRNTIGTDGISWAQI